MWTVLGSLFGGPLAKLGQSLADAYKARQAALTDQERIHAQERIDFFKGQIALAQTAATEDRWWSPRTLMTYCVVVLVAKLLVWDTVLGLGVTPDPGDKVWWIVVTIIGFYYGSKAATDIAARLASAWTRK